MTLGIKGTELVAEVVVEEFLEKILKCFDIFSMNNNNNNTCINTNNTNNNANKMIQEGETNNHNN
jgi:hypothetical protein